MSQKITSKNLSYSSNLPPFLAALHAQAGNSTGPDPQLAKQRRAAKKRSASEEAEDVPLVVDEHGNAVAVDVEKDGTVKESETADDKAEETSSPKKEEAKAAFGAKKRKGGKVVGEDTESKEMDPKTSKDGPDGSKEKKPKKKAKKIKLSFDED